MGKVYTEASREEEATKINRWVDREEIILSSLIDNIMPREKNKRAKRRKRAQIATHPLFLL